MSEAASGRGGHGGYSVKGRFYGFKLHAIVDDHGMIVRFAIAAGNESDPPLARALLGEGEGDLVLGDRGYQGCGVYAQPKSNTKIHGSGGVRWEASGRLSKPSFPDWTGLSTSCSPS
ncbi:hypothetical protein DESA109040_01735 [Deinococcus saxicola]|uniref:transposase n=1 Tax=Deinococcus saxicola TaxID=249406 RepID=UPI0039EF2A24